MLSIGRVKLFELIAAGRIESVRLDGSRRIPREALEEFVARLRAESAPFQIHQVWQAKRRFGEVSSLGDGMVTEVIEPGCCSLLDASTDVGVEAAGDRDVGVTEHVGDHCQFLAPFEHQRREGVAQIMETTTFRASSREKLVELLVYVRGGERCSRFGHEDEVVGSKVVRPFQEEPRLFGEVTAPDPSPTLRHQQPPSHERFQRALKEPP